MKRWTTLAATALSLAFLAGAAAAQQARPSPSPSAAPDITVITVTKDGPALEDEVLTSDRLDARLAELAAAPNKLPVAVIPGDPDVEAEVVDAVRARIRAHGLRVMTQIGAGVDIPATAPDSNRPAPAFVEVDRGGATRWNGAVVTSNELRAQLREFHEAHPERPIFVRAAEEARYQAVAQAMEIVNEVGGARLGLRVPQ